MQTIRIAMAQINPTVGSLNSNTQKVIKFIDMAKDAKADIVVFPELVITGYPPEDLLLKSKFAEDNIKHLKSLAHKTKDIIAIVGFVDNKKDDIYNAAAIIYQGKIAAVYHKMFLPNYGVFDENRYFRAGTAPLNIVLGDIKIGIGICEDIWHPEGPAQSQAIAGAEVIININASPYHMGKVKLREKMLIDRAIDNGVIVVYNNMVGGQDELIFDGQSMIIDEKGGVVARGKAFEEDLIVSDLTLHNSKKLKKRLISEKECPIYQFENTKVIETILSTNYIMKHSCQQVGTKGYKNPSPYPLPDGEREIIGFPLPLEERKIIGFPLPLGERIKVRGSLLVKKRLPKFLNTIDPDPLEEIYSALVLGTMDYVEKNGFEDVVIGLSGGIDSSLVAVIAADAIGKNHVKGVFMPSQYSSKASREDAETLARTLGIELFTVPIHGIFEDYLKTLSNVFKKKSPDVTEENIQARIRGNILMAISNKFGWLVLTTGNKSEMSVGYATLYGDMAGGFAVIKDVPKTLVYKLAKYRNRSKTQDPRLKTDKLIPERILRKPPTAELKLGQKDQDTLPPYNILDAILKLYVEDNKSLKEIIRMGFNAGIVKQVIHMVDISEYKRRQSPPGIKITPRALGKDRRMPITNKYTS